MLVEKQNNISQMLEFSYLYKISKDNEVFTREIHGIKFLCCKDNEDADYEDLYDFTDYVDEDIVNLHPLPEYNSL